MERNKERFYQIAEIIELNPDLHDQESWTEGAISDQLIEVAGGGREEVSCGTSQCIAGWSWVLNGKAEELRALTEESSSVFALRRGDVGFGEAVKLSAVPTSEIINRAACDLGLSEEDAYTLFNTTDYSEYWPEILRAIGDGGDVESVLLDYDMDIPSDYTYREWTERVEAGKELINGTR